LGRKGLTDDKPNVNVIYSIAVFDIMGPKQIGS